MDEEKQLMRVSFNLHITNPEHREVYELIKDIKNKNGYIRDAVLYYANHNCDNAPLFLEGVEKRMDDMVSKQEIMESKLDRILEQLSILSVENTEEKKRDDVVETEETTKKPENGFERFKNMF